MSGDLYFIRATGEQVLVKSGISQEEVYKVMTSYIHELNPSFKIHYVREWGDINSEGVTYDVGSHSEFFKFVRESK